MIDTLMVRGSDVPVFKNDQINDIFNDDTIGYLIDRLSSPEIIQQIKEVLYGGNKSISLGDGIDLTFINAGMFSVIYAINIDENEFILKLRNSEMQEFVNYITEMNRMHILNKKMGDFLNSRNIYIPEYQFATGNICCRQIIDGEQLSPAEAQPILNEIEEEMNAFLENMKTTNPALWKNTIVDFRDKTGKVSGNNFIKARDGKIYFIDPFNN